MENPEVTRNRFRKTVTGVLASAALTVTALIGMSGAAQADVTSSAHGCPSGAVCIYPDDSWNGDPTYVFWSYDTHLIYNQYGEHRVFNNQTGNAWASLSRTSDGNTPVSYVAPGSWTDTNLTPINAVSLFDVG